jgi:hypothetical protein
MMKVVILALVVVSCCVQSSIGFMPSLRVKGFRYPMPWPMGATTSTLAEKVLENPKWPEEWPYSEEDFYRQDESNDGLFYYQPRL